MNWIRTFWTGFRRILRDISPFVWGCLSFALLMAIWTQSLPAESELARHLASEDGIFEQGTAGFLIAAVVLALVTSVVRRSATWLATGVLFACVTLRELDFQKMFTYRSIMSLGYYTRDVAPVGEKLLVLLLITPCLLAIFYLLYRARKDAWLRGAEAGLQRAWVFSISVFFLTSHILDRHNDLLGFIPGRTGILEALVEFTMAMALLFLLVDLKPQFPRNQGGAESTG